MNPAEKHIANSGQSVTRRKAHIGLLDHDLNYVGGHSLTMAIALLDAPNSNVDVLTHRSFVTSDKRFFRIFDTSLAQAKKLAGRNDGSFRFKMRWLWSSLWSNWRYGNGLRIANRQSCSEIWIATNTTIYTLPALVLFSRFIAPSKKILVYFLNPPSRSLSFCAFLGSVLCCRHIHYATELDSMASAYAKCLGKRCYVIGFPLPARKELAKPVPNPGDRLWGGIFGSPREEKGFDILVESIEKLSPLLLDGTLGFVVQCPSANGSDTPLEMAKRRLHELATKFPGISIIANAITEAEYSDNLNFCDFLVLPYRQYAYLFRSSGIVLEAAVSGKPVVITEKIAFADKLVEEGSAVPCQDGDAKSLAMAIDDLVVGFDVYHNAATEHSQHWKRKFSGEAFLDRVEELVFAEAAD